MLPSACTHSTFRRSILRASGVFSAFVWLAVSFAAAQPYGPLRDVVIDADENGVVILFALPADYDAATAEPRIARVLFSRDGGPLTRLSSFGIDGALEPESTYHYTLYGADFDDVILTAAIEVTAMTLPLGHGLATARVSLDAGGMEREFSSSQAAMSGDGRFIVYVAPVRMLPSSATRSQIFRHDVQTGETILVSRDADGAPSDGNCNLPAISDDGRFVAFLSAARNFDPRDTDARVDVYLYDHQSGSVGLISVNNTGDGSANGNVTACTISGNGSTVGFLTDATNLHADATTAARRALLYNTFTATLTLVPQSDWGYTGYSRPGVVRDLALSADALLVVFTTDHTHTTGLWTNLQAIWLWDRNGGEEGTILPVTHLPGAPSAVTAGMAGPPSVSRDGRYIAFYWQKPLTPSGSILADTSPYAVSIQYNPYNSAGFLFDREEGALEVFTLAPNGLSASFSPPQEPPSISDDGRFIAFVSAGALSGRPPLVVYNPVPARSVFVRDRTAGRTRLASRSTAGAYAETNRESNLPAISADGSRVVYQSASSVLVADDTNAATDIFLTTLASGPSDVEPPEWPGDAAVQAVNTGATFVELAWSEAVDAGSGLAAYRVIGDGLLIATTAPGERTLQVPGLAPATTYLFKVEAVDAVGNVSTDGPSLQVVTAAAGAASLSAPSFGGGDVHLTWDPAVDPVLGYIVQRRDGSGAWVDLVQVGPETTSHVDAGLPASTAYAYRILRVPFEGDPQVHTAVAEGTTRDLEIDGILFEATLADDFRSLIAIGGAVSVRLEGEVRRTASAQIAYEAWVDPADPALGTHTLVATVALAESTELAGRYTGSWSLPAGAARLTGLTGVIADGHGAQRTLEAGGLPRAVEARYAVGVDGEAGDLAGLVFSLWSDSLRAGASQALGAGELVSGGGLPAADNYRLRLLQGSRTVQSVADIALRAGLTTVIERAIAPTAEARFIFTDPDGTPRGGFVFNMHDPGTANFLGWGTVAADGTVHVAPGQRFTQGAPVGFRLGDAPWDIDPGPGATVIPADGAATPVALAWSAARVPPARISGTVTYPDGTPAVVKVTASSINPGINHFRSARSGEDGSYTLEPVYGRVFVEIGAEGRSRQIWFAKREIDITAGGTATLDIVLEENVEPIVRIQELELVFPSGRVERIDPARSPLGSRIFAQVIEEGVLRAPAQGHLARPLRVPARPGAALTLRVLGAGIGLGAAQVPFELGDTSEIVIPSVRLEAVADSYAVARVLGRDGRPVDPAAEWTLRYTQGARGDAVTLAGVGPRVDVPLAEGAGSVSLWLSGSEGGLIETVVQIRPGRNDLGDLRIPVPGRFSLLRYARYSASPQFVPPGRPVFLTVGLTNPFPSQLEAWRVLFDLPEGASVLPESASVDGQSVAVEETASGVALVLPGLSPGRHATVRLQLAFGAEFPDGDVTLPARLDYTINGVDTTEPLGGPRVSIVRKPTLWGPESVANRDVALRGIARAGTLRILDGDEVVGQTRVTAGGAWTLNTQLAERAVPYWHSLTAVLVDADGVETRSDALEVLHDPSRPVPVHVRFRQAIEDPVDAEQVRLVQQFPDVGYWRAFDVPGDGPARFWQRMLAGFPFEFEVRFNDPGRVLAATVKVDGAAGGFADAAAGEDGVFRARVLSARNAPWIAGPITVEYEDSLGLLPRWINELAWDGPPRIDHSPLATGPATNLAVRNGATTLAAGDGTTDVAAGLAFEVPPQDLTGTINVALRSDQSLSLGSTTRLTYPGGVIEYPVESAPAYESSIHWVVQGNRMTVDIVTHLPIEAVTSRDKHAPEWAEDATVAITAVEVSSVSLAWTPATDAFWVERYRVYRDGGLVGETEGDVRTLTVGGLVPGTDYAFHVEAADAAGNLSAGNPSTVVAFSGIATGTVSAALFHQAAVLPTDGSTVAFAPSESGKYVKVTTTWVGDYLGPAADVIGTGKGYWDSYNKIQKWKGMMDRLRACGASPADQAFFGDRIVTAAESLYIQNVVGTTFTASSVAFAATGAGAPLSAALALTGLATNSLLESIAEREDQSTEDAYRSVLSALDCEEEDEEEEERRRRYSKPLHRRTVADPIWKIDPSGFVYEVTADNRIAGVTATLLTAPAAEGPWVVSAAEEFGEINPQVTLANGVYAWDVPPGWWRVMYERDGYETAFSDALPVPPPHFDVNIPLKSLAAAAVSAVASTGSGAALRIDFDRHVRLDMIDTATVRVRDALGQPVDGRLEAADADRAQNPHTASPARDISRRVYFLPEERLLVGAALTVEIDGVIESYAGIPMGAMHIQEVLVTDDFAGTYTGSFGPASGHWVLWIESAGAARFVGFTGDAGGLIEGAGTIDETGAFSIVWGESVLTGLIGEGQVSGRIAPGATPIEGGRSTGEPLGAQSVLVYHGAVVGSTATRVVVVGRPDGQSTVLMDGELAVGSAVGSVGPEGALVVEFSDGARLELEPGPAGGLLRGVFETSDGDAWEVLGALEGTPASHLSNVSGRSRVLAGHAGLVAGFVVRGSGEKPMLVRAIGPGLEEFGVGGVLSRPSIHLMDMNAEDGAVLVAANDGWLDAGDPHELRTMFGNLGAFLLEDDVMDAAVHCTVRAGLYTAVVASADQGSGVALVEAYDAAVDAFGPQDSRVINLSVRAHVGTGHAVMVGGFVIAGDTPRRVLVRGIGPGLQAFGVDEFLADPAVTLFRGDLAIADNQSWEDYLPDGGLAGVFEQVGAFPLEVGAGDAALVMWLAPGVYTVHLQNEEPGDGVGLLEIYDLP